MLTSKTTTAVLARSRVSVVQATKSISSVATRPLAMSSHPASCYCLTCKSPAFAVVTKRGLSIASAHPPTCGCPICPSVTASCTCCACKNGLGKTCCSCASCAKMVN